MGGKQIILSVLLLCSLVACSSRAMHEAQEVVAQADSMWYAGEMYRDSAQLAQAYQTLGHHPLSSFRSPFSDSYLHACYHYGRLLREKDDPVSAMQVFINATHSRSRDYHFLGRVYNNIGDICHLAGEFELSHDMFEQSADRYLRNGDSLLYYYCLNDMAYELAEQGNKDETMKLLCSIEKQCFDHTLLTKRLETLSRLYLKCGQYDSTLFYVKKLMSNKVCHASVILLVAQAYSYLGLSDSATLYANMVIARSHELYEINNALYILTNDDASRDMQSVREVAADRSDTQKLIENRKYKLSQAVQLLEQDLTRKPSWTWLFAIIVTLLIVTIIFIIFYNHRRKQRALLFQQRSDYSQRRKADLEICCTALQHSRNLKKDLDWDNYDAMCNIVNARLGGLADKLKSYPNITSGDIKLSVLVLLDLSYEDIAKMLNLSIKSIAKLKSITAQRLGVSMKNLHQKLKQIACSEDNL